MKVLYAARYARPDLLRACTYLALYFTKWSPACDAKLHRLMCYINSTLDWRQVGWVGDSLADLSLHLFADADFSGCNATSRSTSGVHLCIRGPATCYPLNGISKRQGCVSHSTPEAEIVAADFALRSSGLPALDLWKVICMSPIVLTFHEDNQAMIRVCETGRNPTMRHLGRTHHVSVDWLHERCASEDVNLIPETTDRQSADIYTKAFVNPDTWRHATELINISSMLKSIATRGDSIAKSTKLPPFTVPPQVAIQQKTAIAAPPSPKTPRST